MRFWDSSALIPLVVREDRSVSLSSLLVGDPDLIVWWGSGVECASAVHRRRREGGFTDTEGAEVLARLNGLLDAAHVVQPTESVLNGALRALAAHPLRAADSLQLGAALLWARDSPAGKEFVCLDDRLRGAAALEGFRLLPEVE